MPRSCVGGRMSARVAEVRDLLAQVDANRDSSTSLAIA
jgi:hypothetical protein